MDEFKRFVEWAGGNAEAARLLGCSYELVHKMARGERGVSKATARKICQIAGRRFNQLKLLYGEAA